MKQLSSFDSSQQFFVRCHGSEEVDVRVLGYSDQCVVVVVTVLYSLFSKVIDAYDGRGCESSVHEDDRLFAVLCKRVCKLELAKDSRASSHSSRSFSLASADKFPQLLGEGGKILRDTFTCGD